MKLPGLALRAGPLTVRFDRGQLRWFRDGEVEVLRGLYPAVRGPAWQTVVSRLSALRIERGEAAFEVAYEALYEDDPLRFTASVLIKGAADGTIRADFRGRAEATFLKNRIGLCVLHPSSSCAGRPVEIEHADGRVTRGEFPSDVAAHQPFLDIRAIRHEVAPGRRLEVRFLGEWFEMEDHRNWSDASFKTYSTPLSRPLPGRMEGGEEVRHTVTVRLRADSEARPAPVAPATSALPFSRGPAAVRHEAKPYPRVRLGLDITAAQGPDTAAAERLRALRLDHLSVRLGREDVFGEVLARAAATSRGCNVPLEVAALLEGEGGLERLAVAAAGLPISTLLVFHHDTRRTDPALVTRARQRLGEALPGARVGGGALQWFADLNRNREAAQGGDVVSFELCPQVHERDEATILENLESLADVARTARSFAGPAHLALCPAALAPRDEPPDPRLLTEFGAAWVRGLLRAASAAGFWSLSLAPGLGPGGIAETDNPAYRALLER